jgi:hypothetical protein
MANKRFWLGMLVMALVFGMTVIGCKDWLEEEDDDDNRPLLKGSITLDNLNPVVGETITASFKNSSSDPDPIGTPSWKWYKTTEKTINFNKEKEIGSGNNYTVKQSDIGFYIWVYVTYSGNQSYEYSNTSPVINIPATATVSVSMEARYFPSSHSHVVTVTLTLSDGKWSNSISANVNQWLTISGTPSVDSWSEKKLISSGGGRELSFYYSTSSNTPLPINLTATLNTAQLDTMRNSTNVYNTLTAGTPTTVSVSQWTIE